MRSVSTNDLPVISSCPFCGGPAHVCEVASDRMVYAYTIACNDMSGCIAGEPMRYRCWR